MTLWDCKAAETATGGRSTAPWRAGGISIDTRTLANGDLFVALKDRRDGHDFVARAFERGAAAAMVSRVPEELPQDAALLIVDNTHDALTGLGRAGRKRCRARTVGITGSVGKTSTKEMLRLVLAQQGRTSAGEQSFNNHWGVPITLARLSVDDEFAVVEVGMNNPGEIQPLAKLAKPNVALITRVGEVHLAAFSSVEEIAFEKSSLFAGLEEGGTAVLNADSPGADTMRRQAAKSGARIVSFGTAPRADWRLESIRVREDSTEFTVRGNDRNFEVNLAATGRHFAENAAGVLAAVESLGADPVQAAKDLAAFTPPVGRGMRTRVLLGGDSDRAVTVIDDAFNASPVSMRAAIEALARMTPGPSSTGRAGRRVAILGDMLELGPRTSEFHAGIVRHPALADIDVVHCAGHLMRSLYDVLPDERKGIWTPDSEEMAVQAPDLIEPGDVVLVKGSKGSRVSIVVGSLRQLNSSPINRQ